MSRQTWIVVLVLLAILLCGTGAIVAAKKLGLTENTRRETLIPKAREALDLLIADLASIGIQVFIGSTRRDDQEQEALLIKGATGTLNSWHLLDRAVDLYVVDPDTGKTDLAGRREDLYRTVHALARPRGWYGLAFESGGAARYITTTKNGVVSKTRDLAHPQFTEGLSFAEAAKKLKASRGIG